MTNPKKARAQELIEEIKTNIEDLDTDIESSDVDFTYIVPFLEKLSSVTEDRTFSEKKTAAEENSWSARSKC